ncbi:hypothetical protein OBBRIDRAFT_90421 [Obba rivulosa]|uniref:HNH nuclease domain-containing protein n=1 Tax=Obba rivulosa TaxID=1052685 RepID=A0A8E2AP87_9APHY|nr:hypothetical protein OBBRIDRAFT_90421 [Obba rivulosa]
MQQLGDMLDSPINGMALDVAWHSGFHELKKYFEPTSQPHAYKIVGHGPSVQFYMKPDRTTVTFEDKSGGNIAPPDSRLLALHAALAKILNASGAGEYPNILSDSFREE